MNDFQKNILDNEKICGGTAVSNIGGIILFSSDISLEMTQRCVDKAVETIPAIRLRLNKDDELYPVGFTPKKISYTEIKGGYEELRREAEKIISTPFENIYDCDLFAIGYIKCGEYKAGWLKLHHLLGDAASIVLFCSVMDSLYTAELTGDAAAAAAVPETIYPVMSEKRLDSAKKYFSGRLENTEPMCLSETRVSDFTADIMHFSYPKAHKNMSAVFYAALYVYLSAVTDRKRIVFGNVMGNRTKTEFPMFGMFANTLPFVLEYDDMPFEKLTGAIGREMLTLLKYSGYSSRMLKQYNGVNEPLFDISVSYKIDRFIPKIENGRVIELFNGCCDTAIRIFAEEYEDRLDFAIHYKKAAFSKQHIKCMGDGIINVLKQGERNIDISDISVLSDSDKAAYSRLNDTKTQHRHTDIIKCFKVHLSDKEALVCGETSLTGFELDKKSDAAAALIRKRGAKRVGLYMQRCPELIIGAVGALKAGAAFMCISDTIPDMAEYCDAVLCQKDIETAEAADFEPVDIDPDTTAYMVFTSGTEGKAKCIEISRASLISRLEWANESFGLDGTILQKTVNTFDVSVWEMLSVIYGARLCLLKSGDEKYPDRIAGAINKYNVEKLHFVPSMLNAFMEYCFVNKAVFPSLKAVFSSGEKLEAYTAERFFSLFDAELVNLYGPAECTIDVSAHKCKKGEEDIPIGRPADNTGLYIINSAGKQMPVGVKGEICITGELVGKGYLGTAGKAFFEYAGERAYRTGDIGCLGIDGEVHIFGRRDHQTKIRGIRVDISQIKNAVCSIDGVSDCAAAKEKERLICFYSGDAKPQDIKEKLYGSIPAYSVPSAFYHVDRIILSNSGKADIKRMLESLPAAEGVGDLSDVEKTLLDEVKKYTETDVGVDANIFDAGIDSLGAVEIVCEMQKKGINISFADIYEGMTVRNTAKLIDRKRNTVWLKKQNSKKLMVCFPYAGGEPQFFAEAAKLLDCDVLGVYISSFASNKGVEDIAEAAAGEIPADDYDGIYIYGHCVSAVTALETAKRLEKSKKLCRVFLGAPAAAGSIPIAKSPWELVGDEMLIKILNKDGGKKINARLIKRFRQDTNRYFEYMSKKHIPEVDCDAVLIFGENDMFTKNGIHIRSKLKKVIKGNCDVRTVKAAGHYFPETHTREFCSIIKELMS